MLEDGLEDGFEVLALEPSSASIGEIEDERDCLLLFFFFIWDMEMVGAEGITGPMSLSIDEVEDVFVVVVVVVVVVAVVEGTLPLPPGLSATEEIDADADGGIGAFTYALEVPSRRC